MNQSHLKISKFLSFVLRHNPQSIGLSITLNGWVNVDELIKKMNAVNRQEHQITKEILIEIVNSDEKSRYVFLNQKKEFVRASQGHSITVDLELNPLTPPNKLFHGTHTNAVPSIFSDGLKSMKRHHVHLSEDISVAEQVGSRRGEVVVLSIDSHQMSKDGILFYQSENNVWLTDFVDKKYLSILNI